MSRNLNKAKSWIQKQIDELRAKSKSLHSNAYDLQEEARGIDNQILELEEVLEKLPIEEKPLV